MHNLNFSITLHKEPMFDRLKEEIRNNYNLYQLLALKHNRRQKVDMPAVPLNEKIFRYTL